MRLFRTLLTFLLVVLWAAALLEAKPEFAKKEKKTCTFCHERAGSKELNDVGRYYKARGTLTGYKAPPSK